MNQELINLFIFVGICFIVYILFRNFYFSTSTKEGITSETDASGNGIAGNATKYAAAIKAQSIKISDQLLISKYRSDYENAIMNVEDLVNNLMLETVLSINDQKPKESIDQLNSLFQSKAALNTVMKYLDSQ